MKTYTTYIELESIHIVAISLQDDKHKGMVYAKIEGTKLGMAVIDQSISNMLKGEIYSDEDCSQLLDDDYIPIYKSPRRKKDFVYLLERKLAENYIVAVKIIDCYAIDYATEKD